MSEAPTDLRAWIARHPRLSRPAPEPQPSPLKPRLTVVETVYHQDPANGPTAFEAPFGRQLETDEQPCVRRLTVGTDWQALGGVWLAESCQVVLRNEEGQFHGPLPSAQQKAEAAARVVEVGVSDMVLAVVRPGESCRFEPADLHTIRVRCVAGSAKVTAAVFPR